MAKNGTILRKNIDSSEISLIIYNGLAHRLNILRSLIHIEIAGRNFRCFQLPQCGQDGITVRGIEGKEAHRLANRSIRILHRLGQVCKLIIRYGRDMVIHDADILRIGKQRHAGEGNNGCHYEKQEHLFLQFHDSAFP